MQTKVILIAISLVLIGGWWAFLRPPADHDQVDAATGDPLATVVAPASLTAREQIGLTAFNTKCAECHGANEAGRAGIAPPLVHKIYEPSHHGDMAFELAVRHRCHRGICARCAA